MKKACYKRGILFLFTLFICSFGFSQSKLPITDLSYDWTLLRKDKGVIFEVKKEFLSSEDGRSNADYALVKLTNTTNSDLTITYTLAIHFNLGCSGCSAGEYLKTYTVPANSTLEGTLADFASPLAMIIESHYYKSDYKPQFVSIENLTIK